ncbi:type II CAAX prenyl endopeptidase Rce1 family protein [Chloroflexota bacterium]
MGKLSPSSKIYIVLITLLAIMAAISVFLPTFQGLLPPQELPASKPVLALVNAGIMLVVYGGLGILGLKLSQKIGFTDLWDSRISNRQRFLIPALIGVGIGVFFVVVDVIFSQFHTFGPLPHPQFPASIVASLIAGIGEELIFRLFIISFWVWLVSYVILKKKWQNQIFWIVAVLSALAFAFGHVPTIMILFKLESINQIPPALLIEIILLNGAVSVFAAYYFRKFGFLAPVGIHFWADIVWHVIWGVV